MAHEKALIFTSTPTRKRNVCYGLRYGKCYDSNFIVELKLERKKGQDYQSQTDHISHCRAIINLNLRHMYVLENHFSAP